LDDGPDAGRLLTRSGTDDVVDAHLVVVAVRRDEPILTGDTDDLETLAAMLRERRPTIFSWPE
jgi:hypothetical protein